MSYKFSQDLAEKQVAFTVWDAQGNVLTPDSPQFQVAGGGSNLLNIQATTQGVVTLGHTNRNNQGIEVLSYSIVGRNGERITQNVEIAVEFGAPASITSESIE